MKGAIVLCFLAVTVLASASAINKYPDRFDNINVQEIIDNDRLLLAYIKCVLDKGKCTAEGRELKSHIQDALENRCEKCTDVQRGWTTKVLGHLINNEHAYWEQLVAKYDPTRKYTIKYENELKSIKA